MRKKMFSLKNIAMLFMAFGLLSSVGCRKQDANENNGRIEALEKKVEGLSKLDLDSKLKVLTNNLDKAKENLQKLIDAKATQADIDKAKEKLEELINGKATQADIDAAKNQLEALVNAKATKESVDAAINLAKKDLEKLINEKASQADIDKVKEELERLINGKATQADIEKAVGRAKQDVVDMAVAKEVFEAFKKDMESKLQLVNQKLVALEGAEKGVTQADFDKKLKEAKEEVLGMVVKMTAFESYTNEQASKLKEIADQFKAIETKYAAKEDLSNEVKALKEMMTSNIASAVNEANLRVEALETLVNNNNLAVEAALSGLKAEFKGELDGAVNKFNKDLSDKATELSDELLKVKKAVSQDLAVLTAKFNNYVEKSDYEEFKTDYENLKNASENNFKLLSLSIQAIAGELDVFSKALNGSVVSVLNARLTSLVFVPEYVNDKGQGLLSFTALKYQGCETDPVVLSPKVMAHFKVNPSTVTEADIDTDNLKVLYNDPKTARPDKDGDRVSQKAKFVSLENGVLTVAISVDTQKLWATEGTNPDKHMDQLMLEVSPKGSETSVVNSGWISVKADKIDDTTNAFLLVLADGKEHNAADWAKYDVEKTLAGAKALDLTNADQKLKVVDMVYNQPLDLNTVVKAMTEGNASDIDLTKYEGFSFKFDKNFEYKVAEGSAQPTDQQRNIKFVDEHTISAKVFSEEDAPNRATIGRTPIVHVVLMNGDCKVKEGYIKLNIIDAPNTTEPTSVQEVFAPEEATVVNCNNVDYTYTIGTEEMIDRFYTKYGMSKEEFHKNYKFEAVANTADNGFVGTIEQVKVDPANTTYNLKWTVTNDKLKENVGKVIKAKATYTYGKSVIEVVLQSNGVVKQNAVSLTPTGWNESYSYAYFTTVTPENKGTKTNVEPAILDLTGLFKLPEGYTAKFSFAVADDQPKDLMVGDKKVTFTVNGTQLEADIDGTKQTVAEITGDKTLEYKSSTNADILLNQAPDFLKSFVVLKLEDCSNTAVDFEINGKSYKAAEGYKFDVHFLRPIAKVEPKEGVTFKVDSQSGEDRKDVSKLVTLYDWRNTVYSGNGLFKTGYDKYYATVIEFDVNDAKIVEADGTKIALPKTTAKFVVESGKLVAKASNNALKHELTVEIPVVVKYGDSAKFGKIEGTTITVKLAPSDK